MLLYFTTVGSKDNVRVVVLHHILQELGPKIRSWLCCRIVFCNSWVKRLGQGCAVASYFARVGSKD